MQRTDAEIGFPRVLQSMVNEQVILLASTDIVRKLCLFAAMLVFVQLSDPNWRTLLLFVALMGAVEIFGWSTMRTREGVIEALRKEMITLEEPEKVVAAMHRYGDAAELTGAGGVEKFVTKYSWLFISVIAVCIRFFVG